MNLALYWRIHRDREILRAESKKPADKIRSLTYDWQRYKGKIEKLNKWLGGIAEAEDEKVSIPIDVLDDKNEQKAGPLDES